MMERVKSFANHKLADFVIGNGLAKNLALAEKGHGEEIALATAEPVLLEQLRKSAIITSTVASCAIEHIEAPEFERIALYGPPAGREMTRDEKELNNYKAALDFIYTAGPQSLRIDPDFLLKLHSIIRRDAADAGEFKGRDNLVVLEFGGKVYPRFTPVSARQTPHYIEQLCMQYERAVQKEEAPALLCIGALAFDLTCIHPFSDGNGRVSRALIDAALISEGYQLPKYASLAEINQDRQDEYYRALQLSTQGWDKGAHDLKPFLSFQMELYVQGYRELAARRERTNDPFVVLFHERVPAPIREKVLKDFSITYPMARAEVSAETKRDVSIKGNASDLPKAEWEKFSHADKLARALLAKMKFTPLPPITRTTTAEGYGDRGRDGMGGLGGR